MFGGRFLINMAYRSVIRPTMKVTQTYSTLTPIYSQITSMLGKSMINPNTIALINLRELIMRAEEDMQLEMDINGISQLALVVQGKSNSIPSNLGGFFSQTGLIKQARVNHNEYPTEPILNA